jgi:hypothetical protein
VLEIYAVNGASNQYRYKTFIPFFDPGLTFYNFGFSTNGAWVDDNTVSSLGPVQVYPLATTPLSDSSCIKTITSFSGAMVSNLYTPKYYVFKGRLHRDGRTGKLYYVDGTTLKNYDFLTYAGNGFIPLIRAPEYFSPAYSIANGNYGTITSFVPYIMVYSV